MPVTELVREALAHARRLLGLELESAKREMAGKAKSAGAGIAALVAALAFVALAIVALTVCAVFALANVVAPWLAALIVAAVWLVVAAALAVTGIGLVRRSMPPLPTATLHAFNEDLQWAKTRATSARPSSTTSST